MVIRIKGMKDQPDYISDPIPVVCSVKNAFQHMTAEHSVTFEYICVLWKLLTNNRVFYRIYYVTEKLLHRILMQADYLFKILYQ